MFTGIIESTATVLQQTEQKLVITRPKNFGDLKIGQSIATNGACLSVSDFDEEKIFFDVLSQTFRNTNLGETKTVNLERAMPADGRFEGHIVLGHIDGTIQLLERKKEISGEEFVFALPAEKKFLLQKGSICLNGIALTLGKITDTNFSVFIIPITLHDTNFANLQKGDSVNIEYDYVAKIIASQK